MQSHFNLLRVPNRYADARQLSSARYSTEFHGIAQFVNKLNSKINYFYFSADADHEQPTSLFVLLVLSLTRSRLESERI